MHALMEKIGWEGIGAALLSPVIAYLYDAAGRPQTFGAALGVALLFYGMMRKLDAKPRRLLIGPLGMAALGIMHQLLSARMTDRVYVENAGKIVFVPLFLFVSMAAAPTLSNVSGSVFKYSSLVLLLTGILPGDAYVYFVAMLPVLLFIVLIIALPIDLINMEHDDKAKARIHPPSPPMPQPHAVL